MKSLQAYFFTALTVCLGSLSCGKMKPLPISLSRLYFMVNKNLTVDFCINNCISFDKISNTAVKKQPMGKMHL